MKVIRALPFLIFIFLFNIKSEATHLMGSDMFYKHLGGMKYEVTVKYYRDCRGIPFAINNFTVSCSNGASRTVDLTLKSIKEITPLCPTESAKCTPQNVSNTGEGYEEHVYTAILDFGALPLSALASCTGDVVLATGQCCRNGAINTGPGGKYYTEALMKFDLTADSNSSPTFEIPPLIFTSINQPLHYAIGAVDTSDYDSLSFSFGQPLAGVSVPIGYDSGFAFNHPFSAYYPAGKSAPYSDPNANPPIGIYLDPTSGNLIGTPTVENQVTILAIVVKEWRKDSLGVYSNISETRRDVQMIVKSDPLNNVPVIVFDSVGLRSFGAGCVGFEITDAVVVPPPPTPLPSPDTLAVSLVGGDSHLTLQIDSTIYSTTNTTVYGRVCYDSLWSRYGDHSIYLYVRDNACPINSETSKGISLDFPSSAPNMGEDTSTLDTNTLAIIPINELSGISVYPNPASDLVYISSIKPLTQASIVFLDLRGKEMLRKDVEAQTSAVDISSLSAGAYFVKITSKEGEVVRRITVR